MSEPTTSELLHLLTLRSVGIGRNPDPEAGKLLARQFATLHADTQADFFREVAEIFSTWGKHAEQRQLCTIGEDLVESDRGDPRNVVALKWIADLKSFADPEAPGS